MALPCLMATLMNRCLGRYIQSTKIRAIAFRFTIIRMKSVEYESVDRVLDLVRR